MAVTFEELLKGKTSEQIFNEMLKSIEDKKLPVRNWRTGGPYRTLMLLDAEQLEVLYQLLSYYTGSGFVEYAEEGWLDLLCESFFGEKRMLALFTKGKVLLTASIGAGPYTFSPGSLIVSTPSGKKYRATNTANVTLPQGGTVSIDVEAEKPGADYNVPINTISQLDSPTYLGVTVSNPASVSGDWITSAGADLENNDRYRKRCLNKWGTLGSGSPASAYVYWALSASSEVAKVSVCSSHKDGGYMPDWVTLYLSGDGAQVSDAALLSVKSFIQPKLPIDIKLDCKKAQIVNVPLNGTVFVPSAYNTPDTMEPSHSV